MPYKNYEDRKRRSREYYAENREVIATKKKTRRLVDTSVLDTIQEWIALKDKYDHRCLCCKKHESELDRPLEQDHIVPVTKGGTNWISNIQPLCHKCNGMGGKGTKIVDFRPERTLYA